jgi:D-arabinose 1-dehydrogenase-like Zn-dependent alcohol dehydrogenase
MGILAPLNRRTSEKNTKAPPASSTAKQPWTTAAGATVAEKPTSAEAQATSPTTVEGTIHATGWSCESADATELVPLQFDLEESTLAHDDVDVQIINTGVCHSDISMMKNEWGATTYPFVPGHEGIGRVVRIGSAVDHVAVGDLVGIGWIKTSCSKCAPCKVGDENLCAKLDGTITSGNKGCFASHTRVNQRFAIPIPEGLDIDAAGPLLCAGNTVFAPLKRWLTSPGMDVGVVGIGGLGHLAIQFAAKMGSQVTAISRTTKCEAMAKSFGAQRTLATEEPGAFESRAGTIDVMIMTAPTELDWEKYSGLMKKGGVMIMCGIPHRKEKFQMSYNNIVFNQFAIAGTIVSGSKDTAHTLQFAAAQHVTPSVEAHPMADANKILKRLVDRDMPKEVFRFVLKN